MKIVILKHFFPSEYHASVATRVDGQWLILDNRTLTLVRDTDVRRAIPEFMLDQVGNRSADVHVSTSHLTFDV